MVSKKFLYLMFAISIICVFTGCTKKQTDNKRPSVTENAATKEKSNDSNKEKPVNLVWMTVEKKRLMKEFMNWGIIIIFLFMG